MCQTDRQTGRQRVQTDRLIDRQTKTDRAVLLLSSAAQLVVSCRVPTGRLNSFTQPWSPSAVLLPPPVISPFPCEDPALLPFNTRALISPTGALKSVGVNHAVEMFIVSEVLSQSFNQTCANANTELLVLERRRSSGLEARTVFPRAPSQRSEGERAACWNVQNMAFKCTDVL